MNMYVMASIDKTVSYDHPKHGEGFYFDEESQSIKKDDSHWYVVDAQREVGHFENIMRGFGLPEKLSDWDFCNNNLELIYDRSEDKEGNPMDDRLDKTMYRACYTVRLYELKQMDSLRYQVLKTREEK